MEEKLKHLEFIHNVIERLSHKSFLVKSWSITTILALNAYGVDNNNEVIFLIGLPTSLLFWYLDSRYLHLERCFRKLYDKVRKDKVNQLSMKIKKKNNFKEQFKSAFSHTSWPIYCFQISLSLAGFVYYSYFG